MNNGFTEQNKALAAQSADLSQTLFALMVAMAVLGIGAGAISGYLIAQKGLVKPMGNIVEVLHNLTKGDLDCQIQGADRGDEVGAIARAALVFRDNAKHIEELHIQHEAIEKAHEERAKKIEDLALGFNQDVSGALEAVAGTSTQLESTAQALAATAEETNRQSGAVAAASEESSSSVQTVASAAEELSKSIIEIAQNVKHSKDMSESAAKHAMDTTGTMKTLAENSTKIGNVVNLINEIASQTNLLALNATIEAARAGDAGKGFAVVAGEVKQLASQTAHATEEISTQVAAVQASVEQAMAAIETVVTHINQVNEITASIASSVEEQSAATNEIARNVTQVAVGTQEVSSNISGVTQAAAETGAASTQVLSSSHDLSRESARLKEIVKAFLQHVQAA